MEAAQHLAGKAIVVTGAGQGIGAAYARAAAAAGAAVVVNDIEADLAATVAAGITDRGGRAVAHRADVSSWTGAEELVGRCVSEFGALDGLVNNAGLFDIGRPEELTEVTLRSVTEANVLGTEFCGVHAIRQMLRQGRGSLVNVTSGSMSGLSLLSAYGSTKAAVMALTRSWASDLADTGVRVNAISPMAATRMNHVARRYFGIADGEANLDGLEPEVNAPLAVYLLSDAAAGVHGQVVRIQGRELTLVRPPVIDEPALERDEWTVDGIAEAFEQDLASRLVPLSAAGQIMSREQQPPAQERGPRPHLDVER